MDVKFQVAVVSDEESAASLTGLLSEGYRISQTNEFKGGVVYVLALEAPVPEMVLPKSPKK